MSARRTDSAPAQVPSPATRTSTGGGPAPRRMPPAADEERNRPSEPSPASGPPSDIRKSAWWWIRAAAVVVTIYVTVQLLGVVQSVIGALLTVALFLLFGSIITFLAGPLVELLDRRAHVPRVLAILLTLASGVGALVLIGFLVSGPIGDEAKQLASQAPSLVHKVNDFLTSLRDQLNSHGIPVGSGGLSSDITGQISGRVAGVVLSGITETVSILLDILVTLVVAFWLLKDGAELRQGLINLMPGRLKSDVSFGLEAVGVVIGGYVRAQLVLALVIATLAGVGCTIIGVPFPLVVAITVGVFELIPLIGPFIGGAVAMLLAVTKSPSLALVTLGLFIVIHIIEGYLLAPRIQARFVQLHPLLALLVLFAGIETGGFLGAFVAVPLASLLAVFLRAAMGDVRAQHPELFRHERRDTTVERRRRGILREFRIFRRST